MDLATILWCDMKGAATKAKTGEWHYIGLESFRASSGAVNRAKGSTSDKGLVSKLHRAHL